MEAKLKILHLEDLHSDAELIDRALKKGKLNFEKLVVDTKAEFLQALTDFAPDIVLSDHSLPSFNSHEALDIIRNSGLKIPFILITANISEEFAVDVIKRGADDYILKDRLNRLPSAIHNAFEKYRLEKERQLFLDEITRNEKYFRALIENIHDAIVLVNKNAELIYQSPSAEHISGFEFEEVKSRSIFENVHPDDKENCLSFFRMVSEQPGISISNQYRIQHKNGHYLWIEGTITNLLRNENVKALIVNYRDITRRKQSEEALRQSEFRYRQIVETAQEGIWLTDEHNKTTFVNQKMCEILEYPKDEILGKENLYFMDDNGKRELTKSLQEGGKGFVESMDLRYVTKSGKHIWANIAANPFFDEDGGYKGALSMVSDVTEKKNLIDLLDRVNNLARIGNWEVDLQKNTLNWSDITKQIHEVATDYTGDIETAINFYKEGFSRDSITHVLEDAINNGIPWDLELVLVTAKSNERWVRVLGEAEFMHGKCIRLYGSFQDIDARKRAEAEVLKAYEEKDIILESIGDAFFAVDKSWVVTYWNKEAERLIGYPKVKIVGYDLWDVFTDQLDSESFKKYHLAMETNQVIHFEDFYLPKDKWYEISAYPSDVGLSVYFKDVTERKLTWIRLNELNEDLRRNEKALAISNGELEQFAYVASHDLQEPLRMITSFLTQIEKKYTPLLDEKGRQYIHFAVDGAKRMRQIILDLLEYSRVGRLEDNSRIVGLDDLLMDTVSLFRKQIEESAATVTFDHLPLVQVFESPMRHVFQNLISNALKYQAKGSKPVVTISCVDADDAWRFAVKDNGLGINPDYFEKVFVIFKRIYSQEEFSGTGMGLAICKKIVENMGGRIWVESEEGKGSTFFFTTPKEF